MKKRQDTNRIVLRKGESRRPDGRYDFRWTDANGKRHSIYAATLQELRQKEKDIQLDTLQNINTNNRYTTVNDMYQKWLELKRGIKDNTLQNYRYMYENFVQSSRLGKMRVSDVRKSDVNAFYNTLVEERGLQSSTLDSIQAVLYQVFDMAVEDEYLRSNPSSNALKEIKRVYNLRPTKRKALTLEEERIFLDFLQSSPTYQHWYPVFAVMLGTGMRVSEIAGLRWEDIDLDKEIISVNHTLVYYKHAVNGCYQNIHSPKSAAGNRIIAMQKTVKEAFITERDYQNAMDHHCTVTIDGYTNFIFINRFGATVHQGTLNKAIRRIVNACNNEIVDKDPDNEFPTLLPNFSCHTLRHTFTTRLVEAGINLKVIQDTLGHADISTTLNIYADVTKEARMESAKKLETFYQKNAI